MEQPRPDLVAALSAALALVACDRPEGGQAKPASASASTATAAVVTRAAITIDGTHDMLSKKDAAAYAIAPSSELVIEIGDYRFPARAGGPSAPDVVHVVHGSSGYHRASFSGKRVALNAASLDAVKGGAFPGFEAGEPYIVAVGVEATSADGAMRFTPFWTAKVNVTPR